MANSNLNSVDINKFLNSLPVLASYIAKSPCVLVDKYKLISTDHI